MSLFAHFWNLVHRTKGHRGGAQFVAITDPGTGLNDSRRSADFGVPSPINRTSAGATLFSYFGLVPAALLGLNVDKPEPSARDAKCRHTSTPKGQSRCSTGGMMAAMAKAGRDKVTSSLRRHCSRSACGWSNC